MSQVIVLMEVAICCKTPINHTAIAIYGIVDSSTTYSPDQIVKYIWDTDNIGPLIMWMKACPQFRQKLDSQGKNLCLKYGQINPNA